MSKFLFGKKNNTGVKNIPSETTRNILKTIFHNETLTNDDLVCINRGEKIEFHADIISKKLQLINLNTWEKAIEFINVLLDKKDFGEKYRLKLIENWKLWKDEIKVVCQKLQ